jgi:hypothetical protein
MSDLHADYVQRLKQQAIDAGYDERRRIIQQLVAHAEQQPTQSVSVEYLLLHFAEEQNDD